MFLKPSDLLQEGEDSNTGDEDPGQGEKPPQVGCLSIMIRVNIRGGNWLQSQQPSARVYGDYSLIIAIKRVFL